jgi:hypothetical protein
MRNARHGCARWAISALNADIDRIGVELAAPVRSEERMALAEAAEGHAPAPGFEHLLHLGQRDRRTGRSGQFGQQAIRARLHHTGVQCTFDQLATEHRRPQPPGILDRCRRIGDRGVDQGSPGRRHRPEPVAQQEVADLRASERTLVPQERRLSPGFEAGRRLRINDARTHQHQRHFVHRRAIGAFGQRRLHRFQHIGALAPRGACAGTAAIAVGRLAPQGLADTFEFAALAFFRSARATVEQLQQPQHGRAGHVVHGGHASHGSHFTWRCVSGAGSIAGYAR